MDRGGNGGGKMNGRRGEKKCNKRGGITRGVKGRREKGNGVGDWEGRGREEWKERREEIMEGERGRNWRE